MDAHGPTHRPIIRHEEFLATRNFPALDGVRAISVFLVFASHFGGLGWGKWSGWLGVYAFFALSGFLITTLLLRERDASGAISLKAFYIRRATRILPLYFLVYLVVLLQSWHEQGEAWAQMKAATPWLLTMLNEYAGLSPYKATWTLGIEWKYYLVWPALLALFGASDAGRLSLVGVCFALLAAIGLGLLPVPWLSPAHYVGMVIGSGVAIVMHTPDGFARLHGLMRPRAAVALAFGLLLVHRYYLVLDERIGGVLTLTIYCVLMGLLLPSLVASPAVARTLSSKPLVLVGQRSYALYLVQFIAGHVALALLPTDMIFRFLLYLTFALALVGSDLLYRGFEKPITRWGHRWAKAVKHAARTPPDATAKSSWRPLP